MQKKAWLIVLSFFSLILIVLSNKCYLFFANQKTPNHQQESEKEFLDFLVQKKKLPKTKISREVSLVAVGDISYSRGVEQVVKKQKDVNYPFLKIKDYLSKADIVFGNLETPITPGRQIRNGEMIFRSDPSTAQVLKENGFSIVSLANNHTPNFGQKGLSDTFYYLKKAGIKYVGAGRNSDGAYRPVYLEKKGIKFAFLAYNDPDVVPPSYEANKNHAGTAFMKIKKMIKAVNKAREKADFVIVSMHSGVEYTPEPDDSQIEFAHAAIDAGADLVIGHHPHVVQTIEKYNGKYIFYSLGNFIFDQMWSQETKEGLMIKVYFTKQGIDKISLLPVVIEKFCQPKLAAEKESERILKRLKFPLTNQVVYTWSNEINGFKKVYKGVIYLKKPTSVNISFKEKRADLNGNLIFENYILKNGRLTISENSKIIWQSPVSWWIDDFILSDLNNDGIIDINLSLWKAGNFGSSKPFWVKKNDMSVKNHFFILDFINKTVKQIWGSSNLTKPNCEFQIADVDGDGKNDLVVIEGTYSQEPKCNGKYIAIWKWNGWGFSNEWRSNQGDFSNLEIEKNGKETHIVVDSF